MSNRSTVSRDQQVSAWRKDHELRIRAQERASGSPGSSVAIPFHVGHTTITADNQGELIRMNAFKGDTLRARRGDPITATNPADITVTSVSVLTPVIEVPFQTLRDNALVDVDVLLNWRASRTLTNGNLYLVGNFFLDDVDITSAPSWTLPAGPTGFLLRGSSSLVRTHATVRLAGNHTVSLQCRKANVGPASGDNIVIESSATVIWASIYEVIG